LQSTPSITPRGISINRHRTQAFSIRPNTQRPLALACVAGLLALGLAGSALGVGLEPIGGHGGYSPAGGGHGGNSGNGGGGANVVPSNGVAGSGGSGGAGGKGSTNGYAGGNGGAGGNIGSSLLFSGTVTTAFTGSNGSAGVNSNGSNNLGCGGGGGGGGDGIYASSGITVTNQSIVTGGNGGSGGQGSFLPGGGAGGGNGVGGDGVTIVNQGTITGGSGGKAGTYPGAPGYAAGGGGGGDGVSGSNLTISNSGTISAGAAGNGAAAGTDGDAILFAGGINTLNLLTGSTISGSIEVATDANVFIQPQNGGLTLSNNIVVYQNTSEAQFDTTAAGLTVSGVISGSGDVIVSGPTSGANPLVLTGLNTFGGGTSVLSGNLQVDGAIFNNILSVNGGMLSGIGTVPQINANGGSVAPGEAGQMFGELHSSGKVFLNYGSPTLAIRTNDGTACSALRATGALFLGNKLSIHFENTPKIGATCTVATGSPVNGGFTQYVSAPATISLTYGQTYVQFTVTGNSDSIFADGLEGGAL
jgi:hypothetical protein